ncbi:MAG TPA: hypothetical protein VHG92_08035 [Afifellaceae bacterium]|nr:hypothetical protein [Afifellaceae bacterium]
MPSRFTLTAMTLAAALLLAACEREAQQQAEVGQAEEPQTEAGQAEEPDQAENPQPDQREATQAEPVQPQPGENPAAPGEQAPAETEAGEQAGAAQDEAADGEGEIVVVPPREEASADEQRTAQRQDRQSPAQAPGEPSPVAAGVASVAAYVGRWAQEERICQQSYWTFTNLRLQTPEGEACDIQSTEEQENGISLQVACTDRDQPLAEPRRGTMSLTFPNLPQTDTMAVTGGPVEGEEHSLSR